MFRSLLLASAMMTMSVAMPQSTYAQIGPAHCCPQCELPTCYCTCTTWEPVVCTRYRPHCSVTYQDVAKTCLRQEPICETVPTTVCENITVDEGCYQMVWVPKPVTRQVARTVYRQRLNYRTVPYQVMQRIPRVTRHMVPEHHITYVPRTHTYPCPQPPCPPAAPHTPVTPNVPVTPGVSGSNSPWVPISQTSDQLLEQTSVNPVPDAKFLDTPSAIDYEEFTTVPSRNKSSGLPAESHPLDRYDVAPVSHRRQTSWNNTRLHNGHSAATLWRNRNAALHD